jgi:hypothetical protein
MNYTYIVNALEVLVEYPDLQEYIKHFYGSGGFMFTQETDPYRIECAARLDKLLDPQENHSGGSWGCMLRGVQAVLTGAVTYEFILKKAAEYKRKIQEMNDKYEAAQAEAAQAEADQAEAARIIWRDQPEAERTNGRIIYSV